MLTNPAFRIVFENDFAAIWKNNSNGQQSLHSKTSFSPGVTMCTFGAGSIVSAPTYLTVQVNEREHITLQPEFLQYINHSCQPNCFFDTTTMQLICLQPIEPGQEITFFYPSTEWDMAQPFLCQCGSPNCLQLIQGAAHLSAEVLQQYRLTDFIEQQLSKQTVRVGI